MSEAKDRNEKGQFLPGNRWKMPPWRPGKSGHTARFTPNRLITVCSAYIDHCDTLSKPLTWSGLAVFMGISRPALDRYAKGEFGEDKRGIVSVLEYMRSLIESQREERLHDKDYATQGLIFALKNHHGWRDEKHLNVEGQVKQALIVQLPPELTAHLEQQRGEKLGQVIEGEVVK